MTFEEAFALAETFAETELAQLDYDVVDVEQIIYYKGTGLYAAFWLWDTFQEKVPYEQRSEHVGTVHLPFPLTAEQLPSREMRELQVLLKQQGESTALAGQLVSAAGKEFVRKLQKERAAFAALCKWGES